MNAHVPKPSLADRIGRKTVGSTDTRADDGSKPLLRDQLGTYPSEVDTHNNRFTRVYRNLRVQHVIIGGLLVMNLVQGATIMQLLPLYKVVPVFVTFSDKEEQVVRLQPMSDSIAAVQVLIEGNVKQYVKERHTISQDDVVNVNRWGQAVKNMSTDDVFEGFMRETKPVLEIARQGKFTRSVTIDSVQRVDTGQGSGIWRVDFTAFDRTIGQGLADTQETRRAFTTEMRVRLQPRNITYGQRFANPLGFTVLSYSVVPRRTSQTSN